MGLVLSVGGGQRQRVVAEHRRPLRASRPKCPRHGRVHVAAGHVRRIELIYQLGLSAQLGVAHGSVEVDPGKEVAAQRVPRHQPGGVPPERAALHAGLTDGLDQTLPHALARIVEQRLPTAGSPNGSGESLDVVEDLGLRPRVDRLVDELDNGDGRIVPIGPARVGVHMLHELAKVVRLCFPSLRVAAELVPRIHA